MPVTKADREREFSFYDQLGPLTRRVLDDAPRCISTQNVVQKFIRENNAKNDKALHEWAMCGNGPPPMSQRCTIDDLRRPDLDAALADHLRAEFFRLTGQRFESAQLYPLRRSRRLR